mgnify:CR=1 FL=1
MCLIVDFCSYNPGPEFTSDEASITGDLIIDEENSKSAKVSEEALGPPLLTSTQQTQKSPEIQKPPETEKSHETQKPAKSTISEKPVGQINRRFVPKPPEDSDDSFDERRRFLEGSKILYKI